jgi:predicted esterase
LIEKEQEITAQEWLLSPGERKVRLHIETPAAGIGANTGTMLVLHNWGGIYDEPHYVAWCREFADRYNVVSVSVNYLQSGPGQVVPGEKPYDHGFLQAMDCIRALYHIQKQIRDAGLAFNPRRCYSMGGSGGGNVTLMVNKLAPHTLACAVDICGMPGLTNGIAYGTGEFGSGLNAGYSKDPQSPAYMTPDLQELLDPGNIHHLKQQFSANPGNKVVIVHGLDDSSCPAVPKINIFQNMITAGFKPDGHFLTEWFIDGKAVLDTGHPVGNRDKIVERFADDYMLEEGRLASKLPGLNNFELAKKIIYPTKNGRFEVDYSQGPPSITFTGNSE